MVDDASAIKADGIGLEELKIRFFEGVARLRSCKGTGEC